MHACTCSYRHVFALALTSSHIMQEIFAYMQSMCALYNPEPAKWSHNTVPAWCLCLLGEPQQRCEAAFICKDTLGPMHPTQRPARVQAWDASLAAEREAAAAREARRTAEFSAARAAALTTQQALAERFAAAVAEGAQEAGDVKSQGSIS